MADIYSLGVCLHRMVLGVYPKYTHKGSESLEDSMRSFDVELQGDTEFLSRSPALVNLLMGVLHPSPAVRWNMDQIWEDGWFCTDLPKNPDGTHIRHYNTMMLDYQRKGLHDDCGQSDDELNELVDRAKTPFAQQSYKL